MSWNIESFKSKLEAEHSFPGMYVFKFIVPAEKRKEVTDIVPDGEISFKKSSNNKYVSVTIKSFMKSSDDVVDVYKTAHKIEGIMAL